MAQSSTGLEAKQTVSNQRCAIRAPEVFSEFYSGRSGRWRRHFGWS